MGSTHVLSHDWIAGPVDPLWSIQQPTSPWHLPTVWALIACVLAISIAIAYLSYNLLEKPFLRIKERSAVVPSRPG
jgi:peptidoglycan/LPS O-acetylase OafA/YrhL